MEEYLLIGQAALILNCNKSLLRFYEAEFNLCIPRNLTGRRLYSSKELEMFRYIYKLKQEGRNNSQIKAVLSSDRIDKISYESTIQELTECPAPSNEHLQVPDNINELFCLVEQLANEIADLKKISQYTEKSDLLQENTELKQKLKEKTYELIELREKMTNIKKANAKKLFRI